MGKFYRKEGWVNHGWKDMRLVWVGDIGLYAEWGYWNKGIHTCYMCLGRWLNSLGRKSLWCESSVESRERWHDQLDRNRSRGVPFGNGHVQLYPGGHGLVAGVRDGCQWGLSSRVQVGAAVLKKIIQLNCEVNEGIKISFLISAGEFNNNVVGSQTKYGHECRLIPSTLGSQHVEF